MLYKSLTLTTAAVAAGLLSFSIAEAATMASIPTPLPMVQTSDTAAVDLVAWHRWHDGGGWHGHGDWHGDGWHGNGYWGPGVALGLGLGLAAPYAYGGDYGYGGGGYGGGYAYAGGSHVQWCLNRYRTYDPRSNTFVGNDGYRHVCAG